MKKKYLIVILTLTLTAIINSCSKTDLYKALIITGQQEHNWKISSSVLKKILDNSGLFSTDVIITPEKGGDMKKFNPDFSRYKLVVIDYNGDSWSQTTKDNFVKYVSNGGGVVIYHGSSGAFPDWKDYNEMIGIGGGQNRNEKTGPYVYYLRNELIIDTTSGAAGSHGKSHDYEVRIRNIDHPITKGLPVRWMHGSDDLYQRMRGPAKNMLVLATAYADTTFGGTGHDEPMLMAITYGNGRIFHTAMGHAEENGGPALKCAGFIFTLQRGAEWAATGNVTQQVPSDFPTAAGVMLRSDYKEITMEEAIESLRNYDITKSTKSLTYIQSMIRKCSGEEQLLKIEKRLVEILKDSKASKEGKKLVLRELSWMGSEYCLQSVRDLTSDPELKDYVEYTLTRLNN